MKVWYRPNFHTGANEISNFFVLVEERKKVENGKSGEAIYRMKATTPAAAAARPRLAALAPAPEVLLALAAVPAAVPVPVPEEEAPDEAAPEVALGEVEPVIELEPVRAAAEELAALRAAEAELEPAARMEEAA